MLLQVLLLTASEIETLPDHLSSICTQIGNIREDSLSPRLQMHREVSAQSPWDQFYGNVSQAIGGEAGPYEENKIAPEDNLEKALQKINVQMRYIRGVVEAMLENNRRNAGQEGGALTAEQAEEHVAMLAQQKWVAVFGRSVLNTLPNTPVSEPLKAKINDNTIAELDRALNAAGQYVENSGAIVQQVYGQVMHAVTSQFGEIRNRNLSLMASFMNKSGVSLVHDLADLEMQPFVESLGLQLMAEGMQGYNKIAGQYRMPLFELREEEVGTPRPLEAPDDEDNVTPPAP